MSLTVPTTEELEKRFNAKFQNPEQWKPLFHASAFSFPKIPSILNENTRIIQHLIWGLIPYWVKDKETAEKIRLKTGNARSDTIHQKPSYKYSIKNKRCLVLVDGFFEWQEVAGKKYPYYIFLKDHKPFALGGIWDEWTDKKTGEILKTFSIITTDANPLLSKIHNTKKRMPLILHQKDEGKWLSNDLPEIEANAMMKPYDSNDLDAYTVSKLVSMPGAEKNIPGIIKPFKYEEIN